MGSYMAGERVMKVLVDVWSGFEAQMYVARFIRDKEEAFKIIDAEIQKDNLCNVRILNEDEAVEWKEWDCRKTQ